MTGFATCAGFRPDLLDAISACGTGIELGDHVPFTERFGSGDRGLIALVVTAAVRRSDAPPLAFEEIFGVPCLERAGLVARPLTREAIAAVARCDDLALSSLWTEAWQMLGRDGPVPQDLSQSIRGFVVHCRAAVANGWDVLVVEAAEPSR